MQEVYLPCDIALLLFGSTKLFLASTVLVLDLLLVGLQGQKLSISFVEQGWAAGCGKLWCACRRGATHVDEPRDLEGRSLAPFQC